MADKRLSDLYELHIHSNTYHSEKYITDEYVDEEIHNLTWQNKVIDFYDPSGELPNDPNYGDRYIASADGNDGTEDYIYEGNEETWVEIEPKNGFTLLVESEDRNYIYSGGNGIILENIITHNDLTSIYGDAEGYHLQEAAYENLKNQDQEVYTTSSPTLDDLTIDNPNNIYTSLNHDDFNDYVVEEHRQGENSIEQDIHDDNITSSSVTQHEGDIIHNNVNGLQGGNSSERYHLQISAYDNLKNQDQEVYTDSLPNFSQITLNNSPTESNEVARKDYVDGLFQEGMYGQPAVLDFYDFSSDEPSASDGDRYISTSTTSTSAFIENYIYEYAADTDDGVEYEPERGGTVLVEADERLYYYKEDTDEGIKLANFMYHNNLSGIQGGSDSERYHLQSSAYNNLEEQDQKVYSISSPTFDDLTIDNPSNIYNLSHNSFADYDSDRHIDGTVSGSTTIHDDRISQSSVTQYETFIDHDALTNYEASEHRQGENSITENIHDDNITSSSVTQHEGDIDHGNISGLEDDDHTQYLLADGSRNLDGNLDIKGKLTIDFSPSANNRVIDFQIHRDFDIRRDDNTNDGSSNLGLHSNVDGNAGGVAHEGDEIVDFGTGGDVNFYKNLDVDGSIYCDSGGTSKSVKEATISSNNPSGGSSGDVGYKV